MTEPFDRVQIGDSSTAVVGVATYKRAAGLARVLTSLESGASWSGETLVVVADNEPSATTEEFVSSVAKRSVHRYVYVAVPTPGISSARNAVLEAAASVSAELVAFIDDDEEAPVGWLSGLIDGLRAHDADVVAGPTTPTFEAVPPRWVAASGCFDFDLPAVEDGAPLRWCATNNTLFRRSIVDGIGAFDLDYGLSGGGDVHFFYRASLAGARICWLSRPAVVDYIPPSRTTLRWVMTRAFRSGNVRARIDRELRGGVVLVVSLFARGLFGATRGAAAFVLGAVRLDGGMAVRAMQTSARGLGVIAGASAVTYSEYTRRNRTS